MEALQKYEERMEKVPQLKKLKNILHNSGVPKSLGLVQLFVAVLGLSVAMIGLFSGMRAITNIVAFVYPAYASMKAIRSDDKKDDTKWLTYWVLYGFVSFVESITDIFLYWIPMYEFVKMV